jgi:hypothetical protein
MPRFLLALLLVPCGLCGAEPVVIPTFHSLGLYWSPKGGEKGRQVLVRYRAAGEVPWQEALPLRFHPISKTKEDLADYRGSIVHLEPGSEYQVELKLEGTTERAEVKARTWREHFPEGEVVRVGSRRTPLEITESGLPDAWRVIDGRGATLDMRHEHDACITVDASYVILRGFTLRGAGRNGEDLQGIIGAITILGGHDIVIEDCDIADWGRHNPETGFGRDYDAAIFSRDQNVARLIVQRCLLHHPAEDANHWHEPEYPTHPEGPQCITLFNTAGNHVIRYNECWSDPEHRFNDIIGGGDNGSFRGSPGPDSDIYGNVLRDCWDDGLEVEGGGRNVRVWGNYVTQAVNMIANAATSIGPLYIWGNVTGRCQATPELPGYSFLKMGNAGGEKWMTGLQYIFHNTVFDEDGWLPSGGLGGDRIVKHATSRNNLLPIQSERDPMVSSAEENKGNDFDYDLTNGRVPEEMQRHGVRGLPRYAKGSGFDPATRTGRFQLTPESPGASVGQPIPNFTPAYSGPAPDLGAHQRGAPPLRFGVPAATR